ncbi:hypothetical protein EJ02DRAFT_428643 [Clathrospora elynae]|uniref:Uncharacterized protein n=1 Tax=Clathrospora elynae TaxID=706981 RepID=A0A6A5S9Y3_9PLEO|nr:hypothetical protein EJ02DRAFT_428643 [Clathrospora elynae]
MYKGPEERVCMDAKATFRICSHQSFSMTDLITLSYDRYQRSFEFAYRRNLQPLFSQTSYTGADRNAPQFCELNRSPRFLLHRAFHFALSFDHAGLVFRDMMAGPKAKEQERSRYLAAKIPHNAIRDELMCMDEYICPHLRTSSPSVFEHLQCRETQIYNTWDMGCDVGSLGIGREGLWPMERVCGRCRAGKCGAKYAIDFTRGPQPTQKLTFGVLREVDMVAVMDGEWLAKVDGESA